MGKKIAFLCAFFSITQAFADVQNPFAKICSDSNGAHFSDEVSPQQIDFYNSTIGMAARPHRIWHYFWHSARNSWHLMSDEQKNFFLRIDPRWAVPRLMGAPKGVADPAAAKYDPKRNNAGEDFFFMHNKMLTELQQGLRTAHLDCIAPWTSLPTPDDAAWPVPDGTEQVKTLDSYNVMKGWDEQFQNPTWLKGKSLGLVGYLVETTLHNNMHMRWSSTTPPVGNRPDITSIKERTLDVFDSPIYNWLADPYSAHVNPRFWKLHGLVEHILYSWLAAQDPPYETIAEDCEHKSTCYTWKGTWVGAEPAHNHAAHHTDQLAVAQEKDPIQTAIDSYLDGSSDPVDAAVDNNLAAHQRTPLTNEEVQRRTQIVNSTFDLLQKNAPMNFGQLDDEAIKAVSQNPALKDPEAYIEYIKTRHEDR